MNHKKEKEEEEEREIVLHLIIIPTLYGCVALKHNCWGLELYQIFNKDFSIFLCKIRSIVVF